jgi:hypothetical protein
MGEKKSQLGRVVTWILLGILALLVLRMALRLLGFVVGMVGFLLFTIGPIVLVGWIALKAWKAFSRPTPAG